MEDSELEVVHEMDYIASMIEAAQAQGLLTEVIWSFAQELYSEGNGLSIDHASKNSFFNAIAVSCSTALNEWDC